MAKNTNKNPERPLKTKKVYLLDGANFNVRATELYGLNANDPDLMYNLLASEEVQDLLHFSYIEGDNDGNGAFNRWKIYAKACETQEELDDLCADFYEDVNCYILHDMVAKGMLPAGVYVIDATEVAFHMASTN